MKRKWLAEKRKELKMSHQDIANKLGISRQYYSFIESGERSPSVSVAKDIAELLEFDWTIFFEEKSYKTLHKGA